MKIYDKNMIDSNYYITVTTKRSSCEQNGAEVFLILFSILLIGIPWLIAYELYQIAHKDESITITRRVTEEVYYKYNIGDEVSPLDFDV